MHQAKAARLGAAGDVYGEFHELVSAKLYDAAHKILVKQLAPEAVLRGDIQLLERLAAEVGTRARDWEYGGKVSSFVRNLAIKRHLTDIQLFAEYAEIQLYLHQTLLKSIQPPLGTSPADLQEIRYRINDYAHTIPRLLQLLPGVFTDKTNVQGAAALAHMLQKLHNAANAFVSSGVIARPPVSKAMVDVDRLHLLQDAARDRFMGNLDSCVEAL